MEGTCADCGRQKLYSRGRCRPCYDKNHRRTNPAYAERQRVNSRKWGREHPDRKRAIDQKRKRKFKEMFPERYRAMEQRKLARTYGLATEEYLALTAQPCALCGTAERKRYVDHCHATGKVRGALCHGCNLGIGFLDKRGKRWAEAAVRWITTD